MIIPPYHRTVSFIQGTLEEERKDIVHTKKVKEMREPEEDR